MPKLIDLHIHTTASSDGQHTPREIFEMAGKIGLTAIAFADHNSVAAVAEGIELSQKFGIEFVPCMELNTYYNERDFHLLAYFLDYEDPELGRWLKEVHTQKVEQSHKRMEKLNELGFVFDFKDLEKFSGGRVPTGSTFLKAIASRKENANDPRIDRYLNGDRSDSPAVNFYLDFLRGGSPAAVLMEGLETVDMIKKVGEFGAVPVLAHPTDISETVIAELVDAGLAGIEVYCSYHNRDQETRYTHIAAKYGLAFTAGSDFHGSEVKPNVKLGDLSYNDYSILERLKERLQP